MLYCNYEILDSSCILVFKVELFYYIKKFPIQLENIFVFSAISKEWTRI